MNRSGFKPDPLLYKPDTVARNPSVIVVLRHFTKAWWCITEQQKVIYEKFEALALFMANEMREGPDLTHALRELLAARCCALQALVEV